MPAPRRRPKRYRGLLTWDERFYLIHGHGEPFPDVPAARAAWEAHRDELRADAEPFTPWAARAFDGAPGDISPYEHLEVPPRA